QRNYEKLAQFWVQGGKVPWASLWEGKQVQRISLPTYPFEKRRFWKAASSDHPNEAKFDGASAHAESNPNNRAAINSPSVIETVTAIVAESICLAEEEIRPCLSLWQLGVDSLLGAEIAQRIRKRFHFEIGHRDLAEAGTVNALSRLIEQKQ